jgi:hypothetical protein
MSYPNFIEVSRQVQHLFQTVAEQVAQATRFVKHRSKLTGALFYQVLVLGWMHNPKASLNDLARFCHQIDPGVSISPQGLDQRINPAAVAFLGQMLSQSLRRLRQQYQLEVQLLKGFSQINLLDSTSFVLPASLREAFPGSGGVASSAALKVQLLLEVLSGQYRLIDLKAGTDPDQNYGPQALPAIEPDSLTLTDLGYFNTHFFEAIVQQGGYFLSRLQAAVRVFESLAGQKGDALDVDKLLAKAAASSFELEAVICASHPLACRIVLLPVPPEVAAARRRRARARARRQGQQIRPSTLRRLDWSIFITNVKAGYLSTRSIATVYRLRWAVELTFKLWKSDAQLDEARGHRKERVLCECYAKLIGLVLFTLATSPARVLAVFQLRRELSLPKAIKVFQDLAQQLARQLASVEGLAALLEEQLSLMLAYGLKQCRLQNPSTYQRLQQEVDSNQRSYRLEQPREFIAHTKGKCTVKQFASRLKAIHINPLLGLGKTA